MSGPETAGVVTVWPTEALGPPVRAAVIDLCNAANDTDAFHELFELIPSGGTHALVYRDEQLVSHAVVTTRWAQPEGCPILRTGYLDAVATLPAEQGRGHASAALRRLAVALQAWQIGCLQTDVSGFYQRLGWELWRGPLAGRGEDGPIPTPDQTGVMILRVPSTPRCSTSTGCSPSSVSRTASGSDLVRQGIDSAVDNTPVLGA